MKIERFQHLAEAFGGDLSRWPQAEQSAAGALLRTDAAARRIVAEAQSLDALLARAALPVDDACINRTAAAIFARLDAAPPARKPPAPPARLSLRWSVGFIAAMALVGVISGASAPAPRLPAGAVAATPVIAGGVMDIADAGYYSTRYLAAWAQ
jgi:anti-sigma factor RsiW